MDKGVQTEVARNTATQTGGSLSSSPAGNSSQITPGFADFAKKINQLAELFRTQNGVTYRIDQYDVFELIGEGGQGIVFRARDTVLKRDVALKIPHLQKLADNKLVQRLIREAQSLSQLEHPHILPIYHGGEVNGLPYLVCGYCPGGILTHWLKQHGPTVPVRTAVSWVCQLAQAVQHAHERGIVHRDIKPNNVFLYENLDAGPEDMGLTLKLGDFGLAKIMDDTQDGESYTLTHDRLGTPGYMAPEQLAGQHHLLGPATDIYSLGVLLFELLTGTVPYTRATAPWQGIGELPSIRERCPEASPELEAICHKCLAQDPMQRYATVAELHADLQHVLKGERTGARPASWWNSVRKGVTRNPLLALLVGCVLILLLTILYQSINTETLPVTFISKKADCNEIWAVKFTPDSKYLVAAGDTGTNDPDHHVIEHVTLFDLVKHRKLRSFPTTHIAMIKNIAIVDHGETLITSSFDGTVREWDLNTGKERSPLPLIQMPKVMNNGRLDNRAINAMAVSRDQQWVAVASKDYDNERSMIVVQHRQTGTQFILPNAHGNKITQVIFPEESNPTYVLFTTTMHNNLLRWEFSQPQATIVWQGDDAIQHVAFSASADHIAFALLNHDIVIYNWLEKKELMRLRGHQHNIRKIVYSPNNQWLASVDLNGTVIWWDLTKKKGKERARYNREVQIDGLSFSPDNQWLAIGRYDGIVEVFPIASVPPLQQEIISP